MSKPPTTESDSRYDHLESLTTLQILQSINAEDQTVPLAVAKAIPQIEPLVEAVYQRMSAGGRLFYIGAGTSGRLAIVDASECPPTFGVPQGMVVGLIAGGDAAIRIAVENAEDDPTKAFADLQAHGVSPQDFVIGVAASGRTPYVVGGLKQCREHKISTGCIVCNLGSPLFALADFPIEVVVGAEFITGSTRMKAGTAQKLVLNMISSSVMIRLGRIKGNKMVDMQLSNEKLRERALRMILSETKTDPATAQRLLSEFGSVRKAIEAYFAQQK